MTLTIVNPRRFRLQRCELAVPATSAHFFDKAAQSAADMIFLDLEDAVAPTRKLEARRLAMNALSDRDWGAKTMAVRVNGLDTKWGVRDIIELATHCSRLDMIILPKTGSPFDVQFVDNLLGGIERDIGRENPIGIEVLIESALGVSNAEAIAASSPRLEAMVFGIADYSADIRNYERVASAANPDYAILTEPDEGGIRHRHWNDQWHFALARIANACRAFGLRPIDGPYTNFGDPEGFLASARRAQALGYEGKWAIHPSQIDLANTVFTPDDDQIAWARKLLDAIQRADIEGKGATGVDGMLVDLAHQKLAEQLLARSDAARVE